jgi:uncharacterized protein (TIGR00369 family)
MEELIRYPGCFVCGDKNIHGINARFFWDGDTASTDVVLSEQFDGFRGISHGGVVTALLDEVMIKSVLATNRHPVTAELTVKFIKPARTGIMLRFVGRMVASKGRLFRAVASVSDPSGAIIAQAEGKFLEGSADLVAELKRSLE